MKSVIAVFNSVFDVLFDAALWMARALLVGMVLLIGTNVFMRYVLNSGITWSEEISLVMVVWFSFIAMALGVRKNLHISIHLFRRSVPWLDRFLDTLKYAVALGVGVVMLVYGWILIQFTSRSIMPATKLPSSTLYLILPLAAVLIIYEAAADLLGHETDPGGGDTGELPDAETGGTSQAATTEPPDGSESTNREPGRNDQAQDKGTTNG